MFAKYREQQAGEALPLPPSLNRSHYDILLSGHPADQEKGIREIPPIFYHCFSKEKNLKS